MKEKIWSLKRGVTKPNILTLLCHAHCGVKFFLTLWSNNLGEIEPNWIILYPVYHGPRRVRIIGKNRGRQSRDTLLFKALSQYYQAPSPSSLAALSLYIIGVTPPPPLSALSRYFPLFPSPPCTSCTESVLSVTFQAIRQYFQTFHSLLGRHCGGFLSHY